MACTQCNGTKKVEVDHGRTSRLVACGCTVDDASPSERAELVARCIETDPHQWSKRPCITCRTISSVLQRDFGCVAKAKQ